MAFPQKLQFAEAYAKNNFAKFQLYPPYSFWGVDFFFSHKFRLWVAMTTNNLRDLDKNYMFGRQPLKEQFWKEISLFQFSDYKSMETLGYHSNQNTWTTNIKNIISVEANVLNISAKFQIYSTHSFWRVDFWIRFANSLFRVPWQ